MMTLRTFGFVGFVWGRRIGTIETCASLCVTNRHMVSQTELFLSGNVFSSAKKKKNVRFFFWSPLSSERFPSACAPLSRTKSGEDPADPHAPLFRKTLAAATPPQMHPGLQMHLTFLRTNPGCAGASLRGERWVSPFAWSFFSLREREKILRLETCCDGSQNEKQCAYVRSNETHVKKIRERDERVPRNKET